MTNDPKTLIARLREVVSEEVISTAANHDVHEAAARIETLEAALREYEDPSNWRVGGRFDGSSGNFDGTSFAHKTLTAINGGDGK